MSQFQINPASTGGGGGGTVTAVTASSPLASSGGTTPDISVSSSTGSGAIVLATSPTIVTPTVASFTNATHNHQNAAGGGTLDYTLIGGSTIVPPANGGVANIVTAQQGYFWGALVTTPYGAGAAAVITASANQVRAHQFVLPFRTSVTRISWITAANAGDTVDFGIYSADGTTKLVSAGGTVTAGTNAVQTVTVGSVTLTPGAYYFAWTETGTPTTTINAVPANNLNNILLNNNTTKRSVTAGNTASSGTLPSALGTLTTAINTVIPLVFFEP